MADVFGWDPTVANFSGETTLRTRSVQFADGYQQKAADGINNRLTTYSLQFIGDETRISAIVAFLDAHAGASSFLWTPPLRGQLLFTCDTYSEPTEDGDVYTMTATFKQSFAIS